MNPYRTLCALAALVLLVVGSSFALQAREKIPDHSFERETVVDEQGLQQWAPWDEVCPQCKAVKEIECPLCKDRDVPNCMECGGDQRAVCRVCAGSGRYPDPMEKIMCPYCRGAAIYPCAQCWGAGSFGVTEANGNSRREKCRGCKERGGYDCVPCEGTRVIETVKIKKKPLAEASLEALKEKREALEEVLEVVENFEHGKNHRKTDKAFSAALKKPAKEFPVIKPMLELFEEVYKGFVKAGTGYEGFDGKITHQFYIFQDRLTWHLRHQILVLDKEIARAEFNESVNAESK
jgi:uncharacterized membrane protein